MTGSHSGWPRTLHPYPTPWLQALDHKAFHRVCRPITHLLEVPALPYHHAVAAAAAYLTTRRRPSAFPPLGQQTPPESLEQPSGCLSSLLSLQEVVIPRDGPENNGRPWQRPAGRPAWGDPDLRPPAVVASGLGGSSMTTATLSYARQTASGQPCPSPAGRPARSDPVRRRRHMLRRRRRLAGILSTYEKPVAARSQKEDKKPRSTTPPPPPAKAVAGDPVPGRRPTHPAATCLWEGLGPPPETWGHLP